MIIKGWKVRERKVKENDVGMESEGEKSGKKKYDVFGCLAEIEKKKMQFHLVENLFL